MPAGATELRFSTLEVRASRASVAAMRDTTQSGRFSTLEVRASRASTLRHTYATRALRKFQYPRSSGQSCKLQFLRLYLVPAQRFSTLEVRASRASLSARVANDELCDVSVPSKFGPVVQGDQDEYNSDAQGHKFQYPRSSGQSCKRQMGATVESLHRFQYPRSSGQSCKSGHGQCVRRHECVSVPSKLGPVVQA